MNLDFRYRFSNLIVGIAYAIIIVTVLLWSGQSTKRTIYDHYAVQAEGIEITYADYYKAIKFYKDILDFQPITSLVKSALSPDNLESHKSIVGFNIPGNQKLFLKPRHTNAAMTPMKLSSFFGHSTKDDVNNSALLDTTTVILKVRTGFKQLHRTFVKRSGQDPITVEQIKRMSSGRSNQFCGYISEIMTSPSGQEFIAFDFDCNKIIYYQLKKSLALRAD